MAGFGLRSLKKQQADDAVNSKRIYTKNIVVGESPFGFMTFKKVFADSDGKTLFMTQNPYMSEDIHRDLSCSMNSVRSSEVADELSFTKLEISHMTETPLFYKDTKFHKFGSRAKPHELTEGEEFFTQAFHGMEINLEINDEILTSHQENKIIQKIIVKEPTDLVEPVRFELYTGECEVFTCEHLYFCDNPRHFYQLVENKEALTSTLQKYLVGIESFPGITVHFECPRVVTQFHGTMVIPQSLTHDWGSFVLDIEPAENGCQSLRALTFLDIDDMQEEDLAKKFRLMRKVLERVLPELAATPYKHTIKYDPHLRFKGINDELASELKAEHVRFIGPAAPLIHPQSELFQYFARGAMSFSQL